MTQEILNFLEQCPYLEKYRFNIDYLGKDDYSVSISGRGKNECIKKYTDGDSLQKVTYTVRFRLPFGADRSVNALNSMLMEKISDWFHKNNTVSNFPEFDDKKIVVSMTFEVLKKPETITSDSSVINADIGIVYYKVR